MDSCLFANALSSSIKNCAFVFRLFHAPIQDYIISKSVHFVNYFQVSDSD